MTTIKIVKKKTFFLIGVILAGVLAPFSYLMKGDVSQNHSLFVDIAHADIPADGGGGGGGGGGGACASDAGCCDGCY